MGIGRDNATTKCKIAPLIRRGYKNETLKNEEAGLSPDLLYENKALLKLLRDSCDAADIRLNKHTRTCVMHCQLLKLWPIYEV